MGGSLAATGQGQQLPRELYQQFKDGFQPLKMERLAGGKRDLVMQVKSIERKALADDLFAVPAGFTEMKMPGAMRRP